MGKLPRQIFTTHLLCSSLSFGNVWKRRTELKVAEVVHSGTLSDGLYCCTVTHTSKQKMRIKTNWELCAWWKLWSHMGFNQTYTRHCHPQSLFSDAKSYGWLMRICCWPTLELITCGSKWSFGDNNYLTVLTQSLSCYIQARFLHNTQPDTVMSPLCPHLF